MPFEDMENGMFICTVFQLYTAFSRDQPQKVYVTHLLEENKEEVWRIIGKENGHLYVCG